MDEENNDSFLRKVYKRMKRILAATLSLIIAAGMLSACSSNDDKEPQNTDSVTSAPSESVTSQDSETSESVSDEGENSNNDVSRISDAINQTGEWTSLMEVDDAERLKEYFQLDPANENYIEISVKQAMISAAFAEIIVIKAADGKVDDVVKDLEDRKKKLIEQDAFYPEHKDVAEQALIGSEGNFAYLIVGSEDNKACEDAAKNAIKELNS